MRTEEGEGGETEEAERLWGTDVHDGDACGVELVHGPLGRDTDGADEELGLLLDDDVDELGQLALGVIILP